MSSERSESGHLQRSLHSARPAIAGLTPVGMTSEKTLRAFSNDFCDKFPFYPERCSCLLVFAYVEVLRGGSPLPSAVNRGSLVIQPLQAKSC